MFNFLCKTPLYVRYSVTISSTLNSNLLQSLQFSSRNVNTNSFALSYLINSCGFSPEIAKSASKGLTFETPEKPDSVLAFFKTHGFTNPQILHIIQRNPRLLLSNPEKTLLPKLQFFHSKGISSPQIAKIFCYNPRIFGRSIRKHLVPTFDFLKSFLQSDEKTTESIRRFSGFFADISQDSVRHSMKILHDVGVPESRILTFLHYQPRIFVDPKRLLEIFGDVKNLGFNPSKVQFVQAAQVMLYLSKSTWEKKQEAYKKWGWSEDDCIAAFRSYPLCMALSEKKLTLVMNLFVKELGWESQRLAKFPILLAFSLDKRLIPRASVLQFLFEKGLSKKSFMTAMPFKYSELKFLQKFVYSHPEEADRLLKIYEGKSDSGLKSKMLALRT